MTLTTSLTLTIVRHGDTFAPGEPRRRIGARTDLPLVRSGEAQARALGIGFAGERIRFDRMLAAPLRRTQATARLLVAALADPPAIETADWLAEIDHGPDEGASEEAVLARIGGPALARWDEALIAPPGWIVDPSARIVAWRALMTTAHGQVLAITSNGAARFALRAAAELAARGADEVAQTRPMPKLRTGAWGRIVVAEGVARVMDWDRRP